MKAIALISGGLDSLLAAKLIQEQGVDIIPINFQTPFYQRAKKCAQPDKFERISKALNTPINKVDIGQDFLGLFLNPRYGFGSNMNPCIDCKILMLSKARGLMSELGASFVVTGEVLGQRPMSQHKQALSNIIKQAGLEGLLVRPLSAQLLPETVPEAQGWISRDKLLRFNGRGRRAQLALAEKFGIKEYSQPAGGCLLTEVEYSNRLRDLINYKQLTLKNIVILKIGRHFRFNEYAKLVVARDEHEGNMLEGYAESGDYLFMPRADIAGPTALGRGKFDSQMIKLASNIVCYYCDLVHPKATDIICRDINAGSNSQIRAVSIASDQLEAIRL